jgi:hypothetical protein
MAREPISLPCPGGLEALPLAFVDFIEFSHDGLGKFFPQI